MPRITKADGVLFLELVIDFQGSYIHAFRVMPDNAVIDEEITREHLAIARRILREQKRRLVG